MNRPAGRALLVGSATCRSGPLDLLRQRGFQCDEADDPYAAMAELARRPRAFWALVLSLTSLYREELQLIAAVKRRFPHVEIWLTHTDGRAAALAEALRLGADGLLTEDELHRTAVSPATHDVSSQVHGLTDGVSPLSAPLFSTPAPAPTNEPAAEPEGPPAPANHDVSSPYADDNTGEPVLTADELRALLHDPPANIPSSTE